ncbi:type II secretion system minor pseudopilin GspK [Endozoicomonas acroporae]|uniref:type II secretion system minor pseudopilin GspK n=1 Tax=Endozoicomonas acroporae TaxID=1701104 RepID=UPI0013D3063C|nr:type II secretion system minor pseudopilin GspK [Endozoicomonas acroporae]
MMYSRQQGMALIYVLLIFSLMTLMASQILTSLWQQTRKSSHYLDRAQARLYAQGAEQYIALKLEEDIRLDQENGRHVDHLNEQWNLYGSAYDIDDGIIHIKVMDQQSRLNINNLAATNSYAYQSLLILQNLMRSFSLSPTLAYRIKDWVDKDREVAPGGAEDATYLRMIPPYRAASTDMRSLTELDLIAGLNRESNQQLARELTTLPQVSGININTASRDLLLSLSNELTALEVDAIIQARSGKGLANITELLQIPELATKATLFQSLPLSFNSRYFSAIIQVKYRQTQYKMHSWFERDISGNVYIIRRVIGYSGYRNVRENSSRRLA